MLRNSKTWPVNQALSGHVNSSLNCSHMTRTCFYLTAIKFLSLTYLFRCGTTLSPLIPGTRVTHLATSQPLATSTCPLCTTNCSMSLGAWMIILYRVSEVKRAFSINIERCDFWCLHFKETIAKGSLWSLMERIIFPRLMSNFKNVWTQFFQI